MTMRLALSLLFFFWPIFRVSPAVPDTSEDLFAGDTLHDVHLYIHSRDLQRLRSEYLENTYVPADLVWRHTRVRNVAVRSRGGLASARSHPLEKRDQLCWPRQFPCPRRDSNAGPQD